MGISLGKAGNVIVLLVELLDAYRLRFYTWTWWSSSHSSGTVGQLRLAVTSLDNNNDLWVITLCRSQLYKPC